LAYLVNGGHAGKEKAEPLVLAPLQRNVLHFVSIAAVVALEIVRLEEAFHFDQIKWQQKMADKSNYWAN
jgi:hypothetical protein